MGVSMSSQFEIQICVEYKLSKKYITILRKPIVIHLLANTYNQKIIVAGCFSHVTKILILIFYFNINIIFNIVLCYYY